MRILLILLPALLPFILYLIYYIRKGRAIGKGEILVGIKGGPWVRTTIISLVILIATIILLTLTSEKNEGKKYTPARYEDGKLIPNEIN